MKLLPQRQKPKRARLLIWVIVVLQLTAVLYPRAAYAGGLPVTDLNLGSLTSVFEGKKIADKAQEKAKQNIEEVILGSLLGSLMNGLSYFTRKIAYDTASFLASGGQGQSAQVFEEGPAEYFSDVASDTLATAIEEFGQPFGLNLCKPPDINLQIYLQIGIPTLYGGEGPQPSCRWDELRDNWSNWEDYVDSNIPTSPQAFEEFFSKTVQTGQSDFSVALGAMAEVDRLRAEAREAASIERLEGNGFKAVTDIISGRIKTPAQVVREEANALTQNNQTQLTANQIAGIYGSASLQALAQAGSVFINTFVTQLLNNLFTDGLIPDEPTGGYQFSGATDFFSAPANIKREAAQRAYSFLLTTVPSRLDTYDVLTAFHACPQNPGLNNCVIENGLFQALIRSEQGQGALTVAEAIEQRLLHADWPLIPPSRTAENGDIRGCRDGRYCYSNIQKLRRVGILPLGFEIAAARSNPDDPWTLGEVVENFENCGSRNPDGSVNPSPDYPYCHLINPNWILEVPLARCEANVFGPVLVSDEASVRQEQCVDVTTCVSFDESGECAQYGYCTREENTWNFPGDACEPQFATCQTYVNQDTGDRASFLSRTLDVGSCDVDSVGCRVYSRERVGDSWVTSASVAADALPAGSTYDYMVAGRAPIAHFTAAITQQTCPAGAEGCSRLIVAQTDATGAYRYATESGQKAAVNVRLAPADLGCYDVDASTAEIEYPRTRAELALMEPDASCQNFASVCLPSEVGCDGYADLYGGGDTVPGIVGANACNQECVGYDVFTQEASEFEQQVDPLYFVPEAATSCAPQYVGCSEFTNLDELARGGESREYYTKIKYCEKPEGATRSNEKTFYTWEGSQAEGFVLRVHQLKLVDSDDQLILEGLLTGASTAMRAELSAAGSPAYASYTREALDDAYAMCNSASYQDLVNNGSNPADPDCREFLDDAGNTYYRLLAQTVTVSESCVPLRATETNLFEDPLLGQQACAVAGGLYQGGTCQRCLGGGQYVDGSCVYNAIASESSQCPATANLCRAYTGNFVGNIERIASIDFEPVSETGDALAAAYRGWSGGQPSSDAIQVGGRSLALGSDGQGGSNVTYVLRETDDQVAPEELTANSYELRFWVKASEPGSMTVSWNAARTTTGATRPVSFTQSRQGNEQISLSQQWQQVRVSVPPFVETDDLVAGVADLISFNANRSNVFIDNVSFLRVSDTKTLIRDSWQTPEGYDAPLACDSNPADTFPGEQLGCSAYLEESTGNTVYATGFEQLCRPEAVGCRAVYDTHETEEVGAVAYNAWCEGLPGTCQITLDRDTLAVCTPGPSPQAAGCIEFGSCTILQGETGCYVDSVAFPADIDITAEVLEQTGVVNESTVFVPADTPESDPLFVALRDQFFCDGALYLGCEAVGLEEQVLPTTDQASYSFVETYIVNNPVLYEQTLCGSGEVGCSAYTAGNTVSYFKDPAITGGQVCDYVAPKGANGVGNSGWFMRGVGTCSQDAEQLCRTDDDCGTGNTCVDIGSVACYDSFVTPEGQFGIRSNSSAEYQGFVGACPADQHQCIELIDRNDQTTEYPGGTPYYVIFDEQITDRIGECQGQAGLNQGCVLFDRTDRPTKIFDTAATYRASSNEILNNQDGLVLPQSTASNDANIILNVDRDRQCSEWLACKNSIVYYDESGQPQEYCIEYDLCDAANGDRCANFANTTGALSEQRLTYDQYVRRDTTWNGEEYLGMSLYNKYPVEDYVFLSTDSNVETTYVAYRIPNELLQDPLAPFDSPIDCVDQANQAIDTAAPLLSISCGQDGEGRCFEGSCIVPIDGAFPAAFSGGASVQIGEYLEVNTCKAYPESDSPFPQTVLDGQYRELVNPFDPALVRREFPEKKNPFEEANVCQDGECSCEYQRVTHQNGTTDFWPLRTLDVPKAICVGGINQGQPCQIDPRNPNGPGLDNACGSGDNVGLCQEADRIDKRLGTYGFCLEYDVSRPIEGSPTTYACLTWLPLQLSATRLDLFNQDLEAGYYPVPEYDAPLGGGQVYCVNGTGRAAFGFDTNRVNLTASPITSQSDINVYQLRELGSDHPQFRDIFVTNASVDLEGIWNYDPDKGFSCSVPGSPSDYTYITYLCNSDRSSFDADVDRDREIEEIRKDFHTLLDLWGRRFVSPDSHLMRVEYGNNSRAEYLYRATEYTPDTGYGATLTADAYTTRLFSSFLYLVRNSEKDSADQFKYTTGDGSHYQYFSPIYRYAPRTWTNEGDATTVGENQRIEDAALILSDIGDLVPQSRGALPTIVTTDVLVTGANSAQDSSSARPPYDGSGDGVLYSNAESIDSSRPNEINTLLTDLYYTNPIQADLLEDELDSVYVVPTSLPKKGDTTLPAILTADFGLPIGQLRQQLNEGQRASLVKQPINVAGDSARRDYSFNGSVGQSDQLYSVRGADAPISRVGCDDCYVYSYALERQVESSNCYGLYSHCAYTDEGSLPYQFSERLVTTVGIGSNELETAPLISHSRNQVARRYVSVWVDGTSQGQDPFTKVGPPSTPSQDPFALDTCVVDVAINSDEVIPTKPYLAIGMDFNADGEFLGYISRNCNLDVVPTTAIYATFFDRCIDFAQVYNPAFEVNPETPTNKAWTNRVWLNGKKQFPGVGPLDPQRLFEITTPLQPFGSLDLGHEEIFDRRIARDYVFDSQFGVPLQCGFTVDGYSRVFSNFGIVNAQTSELCGPLRKVGYSRDLVDALGRLPVANGLARLNSLFVMDFGRSRFTSYGSDLDDFVVSDVIADRSNSALVVGTPTPPRVHGVTDEGKILPFHTFTINGETGTVLDVNEDGVIDNDRNRNNVPDNTGLMGLGSYRASARFYAFANHDQMPLKRVAVVWGDEQGSSAGSAIASQGFYKNRKPYCGPAVGECVAVNSARTSLTQTGVTCQSSSDCSLLPGTECSTETILNVPRCVTVATGESTGLACSTNDDCTGLEGTQACQVVEEPYMREESFGNQSRACSETWFEYIHVYSCTPDQKNDPSIGKTVGEIRSINSDVADMLERSFGLAPTDSVCTYRPRVVLEDNWGYCNGSTINALTGIVSPLNNGEYVGAGGCVPKTGNLPLDRGTYYASDIVVIPE